MNSDKKLLEHKIEKHKDNSITEWAMISYNNGNLITAIQIDNNKRAFISTKQYNTISKRWGKWKIQLDTENIQDIEKIKNYIKELLDKNNSNMV